MKTIRTKVYQFNELTEQAKQTAIEDYRNSNDEIFWADENRDSMEKFAALFPITVKDWSYGGRGEGVYFSFDSEDYIEELSGQRLATYLWNNYRSSIYSYKYYSLHKLGLTDKKLIHKRVISKLITANCPNKGKYSNSYHSAITTETYNCPLTGYYMDNELLDQIWKFIDKPDSRNFKDLLEDCFADWITACNNDIDSQNSDEYITEQLENNDYDFTKDGKRFNQ